MWPRPSASSACACRFGGTRPYFICPGVVNGIACGRRVAKLYGPGRYFLCRHCYRLAHASQSEDNMDRTLRRANKIRQRLGGDPGMDAAFPAEAEGHVAANLRAAARASLRGRNASPTKPSRIRAERLLARIDKPKRNSEKELLAMTEIDNSPADRAGGTEITRFNALRHGVLSRYTVLPWEDADEYHALVAALVAEHAPQGPTEEHLVEELAGILWRKRRLRLAEAAAHRRGLDGTLASYRETVKVALVHLDATGQSERVVDAIRATAADTEDDIRDDARTTRP